MSSVKETNNMDLFFQSGSACRAYEKLRDADDLLDVRNFIEEIWTVYAPHADPGFL